MIEDVEKSGDAKAYVKKLLDDGERLMGFGHRVYRAEDPRARVLRRTAKELGAPRYEVAEELEKAALAELKERRPDRVLETNVEFWAAIVLDFAEVPAAHVHLDVHLRPHRRLVGAHPGAEEDRAADPPLGDLHRARRAARQRHRGLERRVGRHRRLRGAGRLSYRSAVMPY